EVCMDAGAHSNPDLLIISTDTRSGSRQAAELEMARMTQAVSALNPSFIFKKVYYVLRVPVLAETQAQFKVLGYSKALFVPANPTLGRTIKSGTYFIDGKPIHKTGFAFDPEFPIRESEIIKMLGAAGDMVNVHPPKDGFIHTGIVIGEAESEEDLKLWAALASESILLGGASGFFSALLEKFYSKLPIQEQQKFTAFNQPALYVCGSAFQQSNDRVKAIKNARGPVSYLPPEAVCSDNENRI